jgi:hypothetical protein
MFIKRIAIIAIFGVSSTAANHVHAIKGTDIQKEERSTKQHGLRMLTKRCPWERMSVLMDLLSVLMVRVLMVP